MTESKSEIDKGMEIITKIVHDAEMGYLGCASLTIVECNLLKRTVSIMDKFHIIPRTDSPEKWVEVYDEHGVKYYYKVKLKWRKEAKG